MIIGTHVNTNRYILCDKFQLYLPDKFQFQGPRKYSSMSNNNGIKYFRYLWQFQVLVFHDNFTAIFFY